MNMRHRILIPRDELTKISLRDLWPGSHFTLFCCSSVWVVHLAESKKYLNSTWADYCKLSTSENSDRSNFSPDFKVNFLKKKKLLPRDGGNFGNFYSQLLTLPRPHKMKTFLHSIIKVPRRETFLNSFHSSGHTLKLHPETRMSKNNLAQSSKPIEPR